MRLLLTQGQVKQKSSSGGKYVSVNIGPVQVSSSEQVSLSIAPLNLIYCRKPQEMVDLRRDVCLVQVQAVYNAMRQDDRMKYFL